MAGLRLWTSAAGGSRAGTGDAEVDATSEGERDGSGVLSGTGAADPSGPGAAHPLPTPTVISTIRLDASTVGRGTCPSVPTNPTRPVKLPGLRPAVDAGSEGERDLRGSVVLAVSRNSAAGP